jgi:lipocalin
LHCPVLQPKPAATERLLGDWYIVGRISNWLERHMLHPTARFQQDGPNGYTTTVGFDRGENTTPCVHAMESWFDDPGTFWLLSRTKQPSSAALAAFNNAIASSDIRQDTIDWPYRDQP